MLVGVVARHICPRRLTYKRTHKHKHMYKKSLFLMSYLQLGLVVGCDVCLLSERCHQSDSLFFIMPLSHITISLQFMMPGFSAIICIIYYLHRGFYRTNNNTITLSTSGLLNQSLRGGSYYFTYALSFKFYTFQALK